MKRFLLITMLLAAASAHSQSLQQTNIELDSEIPKDKSLVYEASTSIKLLNGFHCNPNQNKSVVFSIDRFGVFPPDEGFTGGPATSSQDGVVGALPGELNVSDLGAAIYSIPIMMPHGIGKMTPEIAVTYNNQAGNGLLGWGWDVSGLSSIVRTGQTLYHDGAQTAVNFINDRFMIDGKRLMLCSGDYGGNGSVYKTELDEMSRIVSFTDGYDGPARFVVHKKDGTVWEYGCTDDSRVEPQNKNNVALMWLVNKISDPDGNSMIFNYFENQSTGESYINYIDYSLNEKAGIKSMYRVIFNYDERDDVESGYVYANLVQKRRILKNIFIKNMTTGSVLYDYSFDYHQPGNFSDDYKFMYCRLKSIGLTANGLKINPTLISWNKNSHYHDNFLSYPLNRNMFNKVPFVGDFNGDGFSDVILVPYKVSNTYSSNVQASVFLNEGDGTFNETAFYDFNFDKRLEWIYVVDFNGDGLDDVVAFYMNYDNDVAWKSKISFYLNNGGTFSWIDEKQSDRYFTIYPGDFFGDGKIGFFLNHNNAGYYSVYYPSVAYYDDDSVVMQSLGTQAYAYVPERIVVDDINGDGVSEIMYFMENSSIAAKLQYNYNHYEFFHLFADSNFDSNDFIFPGDFNGDGYVDFLKYDDVSYWKIAYSDGKKFKTPVPCGNNNLLKNATLAPMDRYFCSLQNLSMPSVTVRTVDFDGDGKTDVGIFKNTGGNYYLEVGLKMTENPNNTCGFKEIKRFYLNINHSHQYVHIGNFLGHENASILGSVRTNPYGSEMPKIVSLNPHSSKYSVERITDGLGNAQGFCYEYIMPKDNLFYEYDFQCINSDLRTVAAPVKALLADTVFSINDNPCVTKRSYKNLYYHKNGRRMLGFEKKESKLLINNAVFERLVSKNDAEMMADDYFLLPKTISKYNFSDQLVSKEEYSFEKYSCALNYKVFMPLLTLKKTLNYDLDNPGSILKVTVENLDYQSDISDGIYSDIVNINSSVVGVDDSYTGDEASLCKYNITKDYVYNNILPSWVVSRVVSVKESKHYDENDIVGSCEVLDYSGGNPYQVTKRTVLPNADMNFADPLKLVTEYSYDAVGHVVTQTMMTPSAKNQKVRRFNYGEEYNYRYPTKTINENGWEVNYSYDNDYGNILSTLDYNLFETESSSDPFEITVEKTTPDGIKKLKAKRWASGNKYAPQNASYYCWEKTTGNAEKMSFFTKNGIKLRDVAFGLNGEAVYVDMTYDDLGNMLSKSMPYAAAAEAVTYNYVYDNNNRLIREAHPNGLVKNYSYNKLQRTINTVSPDGVSHNVFESFNPMDWRVQIIDIGGNKIDYEYFSDGKLKNAMIENNPQTKVEYEYDGCRNLLKMKDPALGETTYNYNAFGELKSTTTAKNCVTSYDYDDMGNILRRVESDSKGQNDVETQWIYDNKKGKIGTLSQIIYGDSQVVSYNYDDLLRLTNVNESINGVEYLTNYSYDDANREEYVTYPSGMTIKKQYSNSGFYKTMIDPSDNTVLWKTNAANAMGYITDCQLGNGLKTQRKYDEKTGFLKAIFTKGDGNIVQNLSYSYDAFGNLTNRTNLVGTKKNETFVYDDFNRLVEIRMNDAVTGEMNYDNYGNIISKTIDGQEIYYDARYENECPYSVSKVKTDLNNLTGMNQIVEYTSFDKMSHILSGSNSLSMEYGYNHERIHSVGHVDGKNKEKVYVGGCEYVSEDGQTFVYTYLKGPMGVFAVCRLDGKGNNSIFYVHKDHLESWCIVTDERGEIIQKTSYDAWGNPRNETTWSGVYNGELLCDRGFTGHEHFPDFGVINMNGRVYDPMLSMMMSPDNYIQNDDFSQNYNRYSYCYNNPLSYSDPSGEWVEWLLYGIFNGVMNVVSNSENIDNFNECAWSFAAGFVYGCLTNGFSESSLFLQVVSTSFASAFKAGVNNIVKQSDGSFDSKMFFKNKFGEEVKFAFASNLVSTALGGYIYHPTDTEAGVSFSSLICGNSVGKKTFETTMGRIAGNIFAGRDIIDGLDFDYKHIDLKNEIFPQLRKVLAGYLGDIDCAEDAGWGSKMLVNITNMLPEEKTPRTVKYDFDFFGELFLRTVY